LLVEKAYHKVLFVSEFYLMASLRLTKDGMDMTYARIPAEGVLESLFVSVDRSAAVVYLLRAQSTSLAGNV